MGIVVVRRERRVRQRLQIIVLLFLLLLAVCGLACGWDAPMGLRFLGIYWDVILDGGLEVEVGSFPMRKSCGGELHVTCPRSSTP